MMKSRANEIDFLRFFAALSVVFYHYTYFGQASHAMGQFFPIFAPFTRYGLYGVQLFFMISGFVILMTATNATVKSFVISRIARLYPAFWICCTITFLARLAFGGSQYGATIGQYLANMTMLGTFFSVPEIDGSYWTLVVEIRFYVLVFLVLLFGKMHLIERLLMFWLGVTLGFDLLDFLGLDIPYTYRIRMFFVVGFAPYFIAGALFYLMWLKGFNRYRFFLILATWLTAVRHVFVSLPLTERLFFHEYSMTSMMLVTSFFVLMFFVALRKTGWIGNRNWVALGALTYPLYLLHQVLGYMIFNRFSESINSYVLLFFVVLLMLVLAWVIHVNVEEKFARKFKNSMSNGLEKLWSMQRRRAT